MMETIQEILNFSVGKLTVGNIISALVIFVTSFLYISIILPSLPTVNIRNSKKNLALRKKIINITRAIKISSWKCFLYFTSLFCRTYYL